tara:strand:+ start:5859 stop:7178 length:1320 start_codon:yes stop_codon:yes gene_type:complete
MDKSIEFNALKKLIETKNAYIGIIGLGYVGLPLAITFADSGFDVLGIDIDQKKVKFLNNCQSYINHISNKKIEKLIKSNKLEVTNEFEKVSSLDAIIICLPTPLNKHREPDLSFIINTMKCIKPFFKKGQILSLESTTYPGTTEEEILPFIKNAGFSLGNDYFLIYSPEREDPGNKEFNTTNIPKIVGGITNDCNHIGTLLYSKITKEVITVKDTATAEMTKLLENIHRAINIGLMNELKPLVEKMGVDLYSVIRAASTKPFGFVPYYPGPGLGGHCIPIDPFYLTWKAREYGMHTRFIELAGEINASMPKYVVDKISNALNENGKPIKKSNILVLGVSYKKNIDDMRESPSLEIIELLQKKKANVSYSDPFFDSLPKTRKSAIELNGIEITADNLRKFDIVVIATDHDSFDYELIKRNSNLIVDTRGRFDINEKIIRA